MITLPRTFSWGTSQSSKMSSQVSLPRMPSLSSFCAVLKPCSPRSHAHIPLFLLRATLAALPYSAAMQQALYRLLLCAYQMDLLKVLLKCDDMNKPASQGVRPPSCPSQ